MTSIKDIDKSSKTFGSLIQKFQTCSIKTFLLHAFGLRHIILILLFTFGRSLDFFGRTKWHSSNVLEFRADQMFLRNTGFPIIISESYRHIDKTKIPSWNKCRDQKRTIFFSKLSNKVSKRKYETCRSRKSFALKVMHLLL